MSEYQYYEFQAIDRPLTRSEMAELRALSTRATITPNRLQNEYHWGDFKGDPLKLMERYFDVHLYFANWGTHILMLRLPGRLLDAETARRYCPADWADVHTKGDHTILEFRSDNEEGEDWEEGPEGWLGELIPLRADLMAGDLRALYINWLSCAEADILEDEEVEPPVPAGLGRLSAALKRLANFLRVSDDLLAVAAERSARDQEVRASADDLARWVAALPVAEKDALIVRAIEGDAPHLRVELLRRFHVAQATANPLAAPAASGRTVGELIAQAQGRTEARRREQARRDAEERARREREAAAARAVYLDGLASRQEATWQQVEDLLQFKRAKEYDQAAQLLVDLRDVSARTQATEAFRERMRSLRLRHAKKPSFLDRLDRAELPR